MRSINVKLASVMVPSRATGKPRTIQILKMLLPTRFPTRSSLSFFLAAVMVVTISGSAVPMLIIVRAMIRSEMPMLVATVVAELTTSSPPATTPARPTMIRSSDFPSL